MSGAPCPYCGQEISPQPKRARACSHCKQQVYVRKGQLYTESDARKYDEKYGNPFKWMTKEEKIRYRRKANAELLRTMKQSAGIIVAVQIRAAQYADGRGYDLHCCPFCQSQDGNMIPLDQCSPKSLPPFPECENEVEGCRCMFISVLDTEIPEAVPASRGGCLGVVLVLAILASLAFLATIAT